jgi:hypothetical protein
MQDIERRGLKAVTAIAVKEAGGQENCAAVSGRIKRAAAFSDYANPEHPERVIPLDVAVELDAFNRNGRLIRAAARLVGFDLIPLPSARMERTASSALLRMVKENSEATGAAADCAALLDVGKSPSAAQRMTALRELDEASEAILAMRARLMPEGGEE